MLTFLSKFLQWTGVAGVGKQTSILRIFRPFFKLIDYLTVGQKKYINTGYFMVLKKEIRINE